jgi:hypothetical protein
MDDSMRIEFKIRILKYNLDLSFDSIRVSKSGKWGTWLNGFVQFKQLAVIWHTSI